MSPPRRTVAALLLILCVAATARAQPERPADDRPPNVVFILVDDMGYGDPGCYGQQLIATPGIDQLAADGLRFTSAYAGSTVCAPSRCVLLTGRHSGHASVRGNGSPGLTADDRTLGHLFQDAGYTTACVGKWGLGGNDTPGHPNPMGFDHFFGYLSQGAAHNMFPTHLWRNATRVDLPNHVPDEWTFHYANGADAHDPAGIATVRESYSHDLFTEDALRFIERSHDQPFFLYLAYTLPHANNEAMRLNAEERATLPWPYSLQRGNEVPSFGPYLHEDWPGPDRGYAGMIHRLDQDITRLRTRLAELGLADNTLLIFTSDNGPHNEGGHDPNRFDTNGPLRGMKRDLYEGGIRVPMLAVWPGVITPGRTTDHPAAFWDMLPTFADLLGVEPTRSTDGLSFLPTLTGDTDAQPTPEYLYWEFVEQGGKRAVRFGEWKAVQRNLFRDGDHAIELYDLSTDLAESNNVAADHPDVVEQARAYFADAHTPHPDYPALPSP